MRVRLYNGENTMLIPTADPIVSEIVCYDCNGRGEVEDYDEAVDNAGITIIPWVCCATCEGSGELEVWR